MRTKDVVEALLYVSSNRDSLSKSLKVCRVLNEHRDWYPTYHEELEYVVSDLKECRVVCSVSKLVTVFLVGKDKVGRQFPVLKVQGEFCSKDYCSKEKIIKDVTESFYVDDYLPEGYCNQLIYVPYSEPPQVEEETTDVLYTISDYKEESEYIDCYVFTEFKKNHWTYDPEFYKVEKQKYVKTRTKSLVRKVLSDL